MVDKSLQRLQFTCYNETMCTFIFDAVFGAVFQYMIWPHRSVKVTVPVRSVHI